MDQHGAALALDVRVLLERGRLFARAKWQRERLELSRELLEFSARPQIVLRFRGGDFVVLGGAASSSAVDADADAAAAGVLKVLLDVRSMVDARIAWRYQTAAKTSRLELYVDSEADRAQLLAFVTQTQHGGAPLALPVAEAPGDWWEAPPSSAPVPPSSPSQPSPPPPTNVNLLIDEAFQALADAQAALDGGRSESNLLDALADYGAADRGFERATQLVPDERTRQLFHERRQEIHAVIRSLENALAAQRQSAATTTTTAAAAAPPVTFPEPPAPQEPPAPANSSAAEAGPASDGGGSSESSDAPATTASALDERLERLKHFAAQQEVVRAQREHKPASADLRLRLQALRGDRPGRVSMDSLEQRFQRLRGLGNSSSAPTHVGSAASVDRMSAVERLIQQVHDEVALGIPDDAALDEVDDVAYLPIFGHKASAMNKVMDLESGHVLAVLREMVAALDLVAALPDCSSATTPACGALATMRSVSPLVASALERHAAIEARVLGTSEAEERPEVDESDECASAFARSLHQVVRRVLHDRAAKDALLQASASAACARFVLAWAELAADLERVLSTSTEQDERAAAGLRESKLRLREAEDDRQQVEFELAQAREARAAMSSRFAQNIAGLLEQLQETQRAASEALASTARGREQDLRGAESAFESQQSAAHEKALAVTRTETRAADEHRQVEADERKRKQRVGGDLQELLARYDCEMRALDAALDDEQRELQRVERATAALATHFARIDADRAHQLAELRAREEAERRRRQRELSVFRFVQRLQAVVRGFLARRRLRLAPPKQPPRRRKGKKSKSPVKKKAPGKKKTAASAAASPPKKPKAPPATARATAGSKKSSRGA